jgi:hypothetical protein
VAKEVFGFGVRGKRLVNEDDFDLIFWEIIPPALKEFPSTFKDWLSKHVTGCCGVNRFLSKWEPGVTNHCPCCKRYNEDIFHITTCTDEGRTLIFNQMVDELGDWMYDNYTPEDLVDAIIAYLRGRSHISMSSLLPYGHRFHSLATLHDRLGWRSFLEGRISTLLVQEMHFHLSDTPSLISAIDWAKKFVGFLFRITHRQWSFRNSVVHFKIEGRTPAQHQEIIHEFGELLEIDTRTLLPKYRHLWEDEDFEALGRGSSNNKLYWMSAAKSAIAASAIARKRRRHHRQEVHQQRELDESSDTPTAPPTGYPSPPLACEPGFKWKKRRMK